MLNETNPSDTKIRLLGLNLLYLVDIGFPRASALMFCAAMCAIFVARNVNSYLSALLLPQTISDPPPSDNDGDYQQSPIANTCVWPST